MTLRKLLLALLLLGASGQAMAHNPMCECKPIDGGQIECTGGFPTVAARPG